jgi:tetratricopeptide (TPR) repeat protein
MQNEEFEKLKRNKGGFLAFNTFLSTSSDRNVSIQYAIGALGDPNGKAILFQFDLKTSNHNQHSSPFASLEHISYFEWEKEILFSMHTIFSIQDINEMDNGIWHVHLTITNEDDDQLRQLTNYLQEKVTGEGLYPLLNLMLRMGEYDKALRICQTMLLEIPADKSGNIADIHTKMGWCYTAKHDLDVAREHFETAINFFTPDAPFMVPLFCRSGLGRVFHLQGKYDLALKEYESFMKLDIMELGFDRIMSFDYGHEMIADLCSQIGLLLQDMCKYKKALEINEKALKLYHRANIPTMNPSVVSVYNNIAVCHMHMENYELALPYLNKTVEFHERALPKNHPFIAMGHYNIAYCLKNVSVHRDQFELIFEVIEHSRRALQIAQISPDLNPSMPAYQEFWDEMQDIIQYMENR